MRATRLLLLLALLLAGCGAPGSPPPSTPTSAAAAPAPSATAASPPTASPAASATPPPTVTPPPSPTPAPLPEVSYWSQVEVEGEAPPPRRDAALVYDQERGRLLLFGGRAGEMPLDDTWAFDLAAGRWQALHPRDGVRPPARFSMVAGIDRQNGRMLITTGQAGGDFFDDVWAFDLAEESWSEVSVEGERPRRRYGSAGGIWEGGGEALYLTHGFSDQGRFDDTWAFDLAANRWRNLTPAGDLPLKRCLHAAALIGADSLAIFGGCSSGFGPCPQGDTWLFSGGVWSEVTGNDGPQARQFPALVLLPDSRRLLLFGGLAAGGARLNDSWVFDLESGFWSEQQPAGAAPSGREGHSLVVVAGDAGISGLALFGGFDGANDLNDLWLLLPSNEP